MDYQGRAESGLHLLARLSTRPSLVGLDTFLFPNGPNPKDVIDICGDMGSGKTLLLTQLLAKCLLPTVFKEFDIGGLDSGAIIIDCDHHFQVFKLVSLMENNLQKFKNGRKGDSKRLTSKDIEDIVKGALCNLTILKCDDCVQLLTTFHSLPRILSKNPKVNIVVLDSICAYYWQEVMVGGVRKMDMFTKRILSALQQSTQEYKVVIAYTRPTYFQSKFKGQRDCEEIGTTYRIHLQRMEISPQLDTFSVEVNCESNKLLASYTIGSNGIQWSLQSR